jgi:cation diffusion facilitator CzcD-associated flavoprotein CzcO
VAVVGSGCSAIQIVPAIQPIAAHVDVYQRSPGWTMPRLDGPYSERAQRLFERFPLVQRLDRQATFGFMEFGALALTSRPRLRAPLRAVGRWQITKAIKDRELRQKVMPADQIGCKRMMLTDEWYPTLTRVNVSLVNDPIREVTPSGIRTDDGTERPADVLVLATGFKTHGFVAPMEVLGTGGRSLAQEWSELARAYLGMSVPGFPNLFLLYGPNTNGGTGSVIYTIEAGVQHVIEAVHALERSRAKTIEVLRALTGSCVTHSAPACGTPDAPTGTWTKTAMTRTSGRGRGAPTGAGPPSSLPAPTSLTEEPFLADRCATSESIHA